MVFVFLAIGLVGLVIALVSLVIGDLFDAAFDFVPDGALSTTSIAATLAGFGFCGAGADAAFGDAATWVIITIAVVGAMLGWLLAWGLVRATRSQEQPAGTASLDQLVGQTGVVVEAPRTPGMAGTVVLTFLGSDKRMHFRSTEPFVEGDRVTVDAIISTQQVAVSRLGN